MLYNLHHARPAIRRAEKAIVVEGYFDVLRAVEVGVENVVAPLGTALTSDQAALLKRYTPEVLLLYDNDQAGMRASFRVSSASHAAGSAVTSSHAFPSQKAETSDGRNSRPRSFLARALAAIRWEKISPAPGAIDR